MLDLKWKVFTTIRCKISFPSPKHFLKWYLIAAHATPCVKHLAWYVLDYSTLSLQLMHDYKCSHLATRKIMTTHTTEWFNPWGSIRLHYSEISADQICPVAKAMLHKKKFYKFTEIKGKGIQKKLLAIFSKVLAIFSRGQHLGFQEHSLHLAIFSSSQVLPLFSAIWVSRSLVVAMHLTPKAKSFHLFLAIWVSRSFNKKFSFLPPRCSLSWWCSISAKSITTTATAATGKQLLLEHLPCSISQNFFCRKSLGKTSFLWISLTISHGSSKDAFQPLPESGTKHQCQPLQPGSCGMTLSGKEHMEACPIQWNPLGSSVLPQNCWYQVNRLDLW